MYKGIQPYLQVQATFAAVVGLTVNPTTAAKVACTCSIISAGLRILGLYIYTDMDIGDEYVVRTLPNKRLYTTTRYCSCPCW